MKLITVPWYCGMRTRRDGRRRYPELHREELAAEIMGKLAMVSDLEPDD